MALLFLQHVARGAVGTPRLASTVDVGVPPSICHLPPARGLRGASHAMCLVALALVIQTGRYLGSAVRMNEVQPGVWGKEEGNKSGGGLDSFAPAAPKWMIKRWSWSPLQQTTYKAVVNIFIETSFSHK